MGWDNLEILNDVGIYIWKRCKSEQTCLNLTLQAFTIYETIVSRATPVWIRLSSNFLQQSRI